MALRIRKNQSTLTATEKSNFVKAVLAIKKNGTYDQFVQWHKDAMNHATPWMNEIPNMDIRNAAHRGPAFSPWHREFINRFELELQKIDNTVTLPYWDWTVDNTPQSTIWNPDLMGGNGRATDSRVMTGPFAYDSGNWTLTVNDAASPDLKRQFGVGVPGIPLPILPSQTDVNNALAIATYSSPRWDVNSTPSFRNYLEGWIGPGIHNQVHMWVGGSMLPSTSPNDPVFFLHHANIDRIWYMWQRKYFQNNIAGSYIPVSGGPLGHNLNDPMFPWTTTPGQDLDPPNQLGYTYDKCFIATAAYGSEFASPVSKLREFRDRTLTHSRYANEFNQLLRFYYRFSPLVAENMEQHETYRKFMKYLIVWPSVLLMTMAVSVARPLFPERTQRSLQQLNNPTTDPDEC